MSLGSQTPPNRPLPLAQQAAMHVSLVGNEENAAATAQTAIDTAITHLADAADPNGGAKIERVDQSGASLSLESTTKMLRLIDDVIRSPNRAAAVERIVKQIASAVPGISVRCAVGTTTLKRFFDNRMGWLGPESSLYREAEQQWDQFDCDNAKCARQQGSFVVSLPQRDGEGRCVIWIGHSVPDSFEWFVISVPTLSTILWQRPTRSLPQSIRRIRRKSKLWITGVTMFVTLLAVWPVHYRIACVARVESLQQRLVATPFEATLLASNVRPGDAVKQGDVLAVLDGRPLRLERESIEAEIQQVSKEHDIALSTSRVAEAQQAALKRRQLSRRLDLLSDRLKRLDVISPIDGVVVSGDLSRYIGTPLELGQTLIEVAPLDPVVIEIQIPAHEIGYVAADADTRVRFAALGGESIRAPLTDLYPSAELREDRNVFVGRVEVDNSNRKLRPGMTGDATTYGPLRPWIWSWVRSAFERVLWWSGY